MRIYPCSRGFLAVCRGVEAYAVSRQAAVRAVLAQLV